MFKRLLLTSAATLFLSAPLQGMAADGPSWDYLSLEAVVSGKIEEGSWSEDLSGYRLDAVKSLGDIAFVRAKVNAYYISEGGEDFDLSTRSVGVGARYRLPVDAVPVDVWGSLNYEQLSFEILGSGPSIDIGARAQVTPELDVGLTAKVV